MNKVIAVDNPDLLPVVMIVSHDSAALAGSTIPLLGILREVNKINPTPGNQELIELAMNATMTVGFLASLITILLGRDTVRAFITGTSEQEKEAIRKSGMGFVERELEKRGQM